MREHLNNAKERRSHGASRTANPLGLSKDDLLAAKKNPELYTSLLLGRNASQTTSASAMVESLMAAQKEADAQNEATTRTTSTASPEHQTATVARASEPSEPTGANDDEGLPDTSL